ncbi:LysR family transcriptional regulator [Epilithonimonas hungarica]|uniref:DNA-binding transcriptional regulator, LysR family n=1 Tax=Epilithonimonas hungarica TaxID=454006 RepID=A0A1G7JV66_9FLAO|nr:LysR substrate-binding domain-containing protein [Epilithonimonas hungarica]SDF28704.1 DNA-binding transcriptional regulator, LysR family [Epilithonimonas hungarica]
MEFRLLVFYTVARLLSFSKASEELFISQPAVTKHIKELEARYKVALFERSGNRNVRLTEAGKLLLDYAEKMQKLSREVSFEISHLSQNFRGELRIGASSTISQYVMPRFLAKFHQKFPEIKIRMTTGNSSEIQQSLLKKEINLGIIEDSGKIPEVRYEDFLEDEIVLIGKNFGTGISKETISVKKLMDYPLVLRENGSGTLEVIAEYLLNNQIKISQLQPEMQLGSTEAIKNYVLESDCLAMVSIHSILKELKENTLKIIELKEGKILRKFRFIELHGQNDALSNFFKNYLKS